MKYNRDNIKGMLAYCLEKEGFTLNDFEAYLTQQKTAADGIGVKDVLGTAAKVPGAAANLLKLLAFSAVVPGAVAGLGTYGAISANRDSDDRISDANETKRKIDAARRELEAQKLQQGI